MQVISRLFSRASSLAFAFPLAQRWRPARSVRGESWRRVERMYSCWVNTFDEHPSRLFAPKT
eukprot:7155450-Pyramimonas_sp.AAC.1